MKDKSLNEKWAEAQVAAYRRLGAVTLQSLQENMPANREEASPSRRKKRTLRHPFGG